MTAKDKLLTEAEVAELLRLDRGTLTVWRNTKREELPFFKLGRAVRYREKDVLEFIKRGASR